MEDLDFYIKKYLLLHKISFAHFPSIYKTIYRELSRLDLNSCCEDECSKERSVEINFKQTLKVTMKSNLVPTHLFKHLVTILRSIFSCNGRDCCGFQI